MLLVVVGLTAAGCGSGGKSPGVASLGGHGTTTSQDPASAGSGLSTGGGPSGAAGAKGMHLAMRGSLKFSQCMRAHGVSKFPDPNSSGQIGIDSSSGISPDSPMYRSAQKACSSLLPNGGKATPQELAKAKQAALAHSECMRAHGVKDYPDPDFSGGGVKLSLGGSSNSDLNPNNPTFKRALQACGTLIRPAKP